MGYRVEMGISVQIPDDQEPGDIEIIGTLREENENARLAFDEYGTSNHMVKWCEREKDMKAFSGRFPHCLFSISCRGEDGEEWIEYYKGGKMAIIELVITWPEFDEGILE